MTHVDFTSARSGFTDLFNRVFFRGERVIIERRGKDKVAVVPLEDLERLEALEDQADIAAADAAMKDRAPRIPYEQIRKELGL
jgi:prevent-host-death family protein